jgi:S-layer homology domain
MFGFNGILSRCLAISLILSVYGCSGGKSVQNKLAPDPRLVNSSSTNPSAADKATPTNSTLPTDFPTYPQAKLKSTEPTSDRGTVTIWTTPDPIDLIYAFYQKELTAKQWQIVSQPTDSEPRLVAKKADVNISIGIETSKEKQQTGVTVFSINLPPTADSSSAVAAAPTPSPSTSPPSKPSENKPEPTTNPDYIADLTKIGVLTSADTAASNSKPSSPRSITRREYVRWLVAAYNRIHSTKPTQQIKLATADTKPTFQDVPASHPDFASIQGLAEAGLIPSPLSGDATEVLFRPESPLSREQLILWKVPLDTRQPLPTASLDAVKQTWGFQDAGKVEPKAIRAILADFQNGDKSNIRRVFGYTTLFQPKKTVNLGEVAATIWYFGANSEGLSAHDAISTN